jgi:hypothetical protein
VQKLAGVRFPQRTPEVIAPVWSAIQKVGF